MQDYRGVLVIHGSPSEPIAIRLAMDLRSDGIFAQPIALAKLAPTDWQGELQAVTGVVIIYDGQTIITEEVEAALDTIRSTRPVVFARSRNSRVHPAFNKFNPVPLFEGQTFSYYQPQGNREGYARVVDYLGGPKRVKDARKRGFAFLSYASEDRQFVDKMLIPALAACNVGFFDYRFTDRLDERKLDNEIKRRIQRCAMIVAHTSASWSEKKYTHVEESLAVQLGRPIIEITQMGQPARLESARTMCEFSGDLDSNSKQLIEAITGALAGTRNLKFLRFDQPR